MKLFAHLFRSNSGPRAPRESGAYIHHTEGSITILTFFRDHESAEAIKHCADLTARGVKYSIRFIEPEAHS